MHTGNLDLSLDQITKIEGHATVNLKVRDGDIQKCEFSIAEFKRFYSKAIQGKAMQAVPALVSRICGTCSNAHLLCSLKAIEDSQAIQVSEQTVILRQLLNHGLMIRDHALHLYIFSLPDLYNRESIFEFDETSPEEHELLHDALAVKEAGNQLAIWSGGRSVHAPNLVVGGFAKLPEEGKQELLIKQLENIRPRVIKLIKIFKNCEFKQEEDFSFSALASDTYDYLSGDIVKANGESVPAKEYGDHLEYAVVPYSQASGYRFKGKIYMVGALARINLNREYLHERTRQDASEALSLFSSKNIFHNNLSQAIEILHSIDQSIDTLKNLSIQDEKPIVKPPQAGVGVGVIEAPRGTLYHKYEVNEKGMVTKAKIIVPTGQNQIAIEKSLLHLAESHPDLLNEERKEKLSFEFEKLVRAYDPCMSCASHFLKVKISYPN